MNNHGNLGGMIMKTRNIFIFAAAVLAVSCAKEIVPAENNPTVEPVLVPMEFTASVDTKAFLLEDGRTVNWNNNESICLFDNLGGDQQFTAATGGASAYFSGNVTEGSTEFYALYPYREGAGFDVDTKKIASTLSPDQIAVRGSYAKGDGGAVMVAKADADKVLSFKNVTSHIRFTLAEDMTDVKSITLIGNRSEALCGTYSVDWNSGEPLVTITEKETYVTLKNEDGSALEPGDYFFTVLPVEFTEGFTVILSKMETGEQVAKKTLNPITELNRRNQILPMAALASGDYSAHMNYFVKYNDGFDITIGGYTFNKTDRPGGVLVNDTKGNTNCHKDGLYFIEPTSSAAGFSNNPNVQNLIIVGAEEGTRSKFAFGKAIRPLTDGKIIMMANLDCNITASNVIVHHSTNKFSSYGKMVFDNCHFRSIPKNHFMNFNIENWNMDSMAIENCEFGFAAANAYLLHCGTTECQIKNMSVVNNIFYSKEGMTMTDFKLIGGTALKLEGLVVDANTFEGTIIGENMVNIGDASSVSLTRNLHVNCSAATNVKLIKFNSTSHVAGNVTGQVRQNYSYSTGTGSLGNGVGTSGGYTGIEFISLRTLQNYPLSADWAPETDSFGPYSSDVPEGVGAQRSDMTLTQTDSSSSDYSSSDLGTI